MIELNVELGSNSYPIWMGRGLLSQGEVWRTGLPGRQIALVSNTVVAPLYLDVLKEQLSDYQLIEIVLPDGERYKNLDALESIWHKLLTEQFSRNSTIIALGGGVVGDTAGFAAACYQRGIAYLQMPTTLLAQVDSSVGGKTAVNHALGKNMIGAFYQPHGVVIDIDVLSTLPDRELSAGLAEVIKYGLIADVAFLEWLEAHIEALLARDPEALMYAIEHSCRQKAAVVAADEREAGLRAILNLGHTFGHAIEAGMGYGQYLHGEAVAIGMCQAADLSRRLGWLDDAEVERIAHLLQRARLPVKPPESLSSERFLHWMGVDKKNLNGQIRLILLRCLGEATPAMTVDIALLQATLETYGR
ncbi:MAG: 3-dehydroquinate synthase [Methylococcales bacterium]|nr:3-dehydroquinate synthase [Methylococcales bacterium]